MQPRLLESAVDPVIDSTTTSRNRREEDDRTRWESPNTVTAGMSLDKLVPTSTVEYP